MSEIKRSDALDKLFVSIYGNRNVNYDQKTIIINDDRIKKTLYSPVSKANIQYLIELTFTCADVKFEDKKRGKNFNLTKENIIKNTITYFRSLGIDIPEVVNKTEIQLLAKRLCNALIEQILPAIFRNIDDTKRKFEIEMDDISLTFNRAIKNVKTDFGSNDFFEWLYTDIKASEVENLFDYDFDEEECNYGVLVCSAFRNIFNKLNYVASIYYRNLNKENCTETFDNDINLFTGSSFVNQVALENKNFISPYYYCINKENIDKKTNNKHDEYSINFNACLSSSRFVPRYFYFMTKIDEEIFEKDYFNSKTLDMLNLNLTEKAVEQFKEKYTDDIIQYYKSLFVFIEDMCSNFLLTDIEKILSYRVESLEDFKNELSHLCNRNDIDTVWHFCEENGLNAKQSIKYIYCSIEEAMYDFLFLILNSFSSIARADTQNEIIRSKSQLLSDIEKYLSVSEIKKHVRNLREIFKSKDLDKLCEIRSNYSNFKWNTNKGFNLTYRNVADTWPNFGINVNIYQYFKTFKTCYYDELT